MQNEAAGQCLQSVSLLKECAYVILENIRKQNFAAAGQLMKNSTELLRSIQRNCASLNSLPHLKFTLNLDNILFSLRNVFLLFSKRAQSTEDKIEFEYIPLLQEFYFLVYYYSHDMERADEYRQYEEQYSDLTDNLYLRNSAQTGSYKYDVSITVCAYNKLEYTKQCVESILKYTDKNLNYEIVLVNNGSTDGTHAYFESLGIRKYLHIKNNSMISGAAGRVSEGRYTCGVSNDVVVTKNYLNNMLRCIKSDPKNVMVVPSTSFVSNLQAVNPSCSSAEEIQRFAEGYNKPDPYRWEQRTRLCNPITLFDMDTVMKNSNRLMLADKRFVFYEFHDDAVCARIRRAGLKMILDKDCYCHHFGSITLGEAQKTSNTLEKSRDLFFKSFGFDAWGTGFCYDWTLMEKLPCQFAGPVNILGINAGIGSNPLKIKELLREKTHAEGVTLYNVTDEEVYYTDLKGTSDCVLKIKGKINFQLIFQDIKFHYILFEGGIERYNIHAESRKLMNRLADSGILIVRDTQMPGAVRIPSTLYKGHCWYMYQKS